MRYPSIHLNGTSGKQLQAEYAAAAHELDKAIKALEDVTVHGRDYYVQNSATGPDAICEAIDEHRARLRKLREVYLELIQIHANIDKQVKP